MATGQALRLQHELRPMTLGQRRAPVSTAIGLGVVVAGSSMAAITPCFGRGWALTALAMPPPEQWAWGQEGDKARTTEQPAPS